MASQFRIVLIGGGGHCGVVVDILNRVGGYEIVGIADKPERVGETVSGIEIRYTDSDLSQLRGRGTDYALVTVGTTYSTRLRKSIFDRVSALGFTFPTIIDPDAVVLGGVEFGPGAVVMPDVVVGTHTHIGSNCIINTGAVVEHDCFLHDHVHIAPGAVVSGSVEIGENTFVGAGSCIIQTLKIGSDTTLGAGSVVVTSLPNGVVAYGNPARIVRRSAEGRRGPSRLVD